MAPEYYWCRIFDLPIESKKDVLNVLPNMFEDFIDITNLKFYAKKLEDGKYLCFGYDEEKILEAIGLAQLSVNQIKNIYFAQIELETLVKTTAQTCMKVDDICLSYIDGILVQIPIVLKVNIDNDINIDNIQLSKNTIYVNSHSKYIDSKYSYMLSVVFILLSLVSFMKIVSNNNIISDIPSKIETIKKEYNMPPSIIQAKSIIKKLDKAVVQQQKLREALSYLLKYTKQNNIQITDINLNNDKIICRMTDTTLKKIKLYINKKYKLSTGKKNGKIITVGFSI
ncbi:MAG: hypothetical protein U9N59_15685 [Campylobacterota bacterium]|nr:hypothetical protein [Campylobacterota bacterium]